MNELIHKTKTNKNPKTNKKQNKTTTTTTTKRTKYGRKREHPKNTAMIKNKRTLMT